VSILKLCSLFDDTYVIIRLSAEYTYPTVEKGVYRKVGYKGAVFAFFAQPTGTESAKIEFQLKIID